MAFDRAFKQTLNKTMTFKVKETKLCVALQQLSKKGRLKHDLQFTFVY